MIRKLRLEGVSSLHHSIEDFFLFSIIYRIIDVGAVICKKSFEIYAPDLCASVGKYSRRLIWSFFANPQCGYFWLDKAFSWPINAKSGLLHNCVFRQDKRGEKVLVIKKFSSALPCHISMLFTLPLLFVFSCTSFDALSRLFLLIPRILMWQCIQLSFFWS